MLRSSLFRRAAAPPPPPPPKNQQSEHSFAVDEDEAAFFSRNELSEFSPVLQGLLEENVDFVYEDDAALATTTSTNDGQALAATSTDSCDDNDRDSISPNQNRFWMQCMDGQHSRRYSTDSSRRSSLESVKMLAGTGLGMGITRAATKFSPAKTLTEKNENTATSVTVPLKPQGKHLGSTSHDTSDSGYMYKASIPTSKTFTDSYDDTELYKEDSLLHSKSSFFFEEMLPKDDKEEDDNENKSSIDRIESARRQNYVMRQKCVLDQDEDDNLATAVPESAKFPYGLGKNQGEVTQQTHHIRSVFSSTGGNSRSSSNVFSSIEASSSSGSSAFSSTEGSSGSSVLSSPSSSVHAALQIRHTVSFVQSASSTEESLQGVYAVSSDEQDSLALILDAKESVDSPAISETASFASRRLGILPSQDILEEQPGIPAFLSRGIVKKPVDLTEKDGDDDESVQGSQDGSYDDELLLTVLQDDSDDQSNISLNHYDPKQVQELARELERISSDLEEQEVEIEQALERINSDLEDQGPAAVNEFSYLADLPEDTNGSLENQKSAAMNEFSYLADLQEELEVLSNPSDESIGEPTVNIASGLSTEPKEPSVKAVAIDDLATEYQVENISPVLSSEPKVQVQPNPAPLAESRAVLPNNDDESEGSSEGLAKPFLKPQESDRASFLDRSKEVIEQAERLVFASPLKSRSRLTNVSDEAQVIDRPTLKSPVQSRFYPTMAPDEPQEQTVPESPTKFQWSAKPPLVEPVPKPVSKASPRSRSYLANVPDERPQEQAVPESPSKIQLSAKPLLVEPAPKPVSKASPRSRSYLANVPDERPQEQAVPESPSKIQWSAKPPLVELAPKPVSKASPRSRSHVANVPDEWPQEQAIPESPSKIHLSAKPLLVEPAPKPVSKVSPRSRSYLANAPDERPQEQAVPESLSKIHLSAKPLLVEPAAKPVSKALANVPDEPQEPTVHESPSKVTMQFDPAALPVSRASPRSRSYLANVPDVPQEKTTVSESPSKSNCSAKPPLVEPAPRPVSKASPRSRSYLANVPFDPQERSVTDSPSKVASQFERAANRSSPANIPDEPQSETGQAAASPRFVSPPRSPALTSPPRIRSYLADPPQPGIGQATTNPSAALKCPPNTLANIPDDKPHKVEQETKHFWKSSPKSRLNEPRPGAGPSAASPASLQSPPKRRSYLTNVPDESEEVEQAAASPRFASPPRSPALTFPPKSQSVPDEPQSGIGQSTASPCAALKSPPKSRFYVANGPHDEPQEVDQAAANSTIMPPTKMQSDKVLEDPEHIRPDESKRKSKEPDKPVTLNTVHSKVVDAPEAPKEEIKLVPRSPVKTRAKSTTKLTVEVASPPPAEKDPYEWAYAVWRRRGIMKVGQVEPRPVNLVAGTLVEQDKVPQNSVAQVAEASSKQEYETIITPRESLITHLDLQGVDYNAPRAFNGGRSSLPVATASAKKSQGRKSFANVLEKWRVKSDDKPNTHFLSPESRVLEHDGNVSITHSTSSSHPKQRNAYTEAEKPGTDSSESFYFEAIKHQRTVDTVKGPSKQPPPRLSLGSSTRITQSVVPAVGTPTVGAEPKKASPTTQASKIKAAYNKQHTSKPSNEVKVESRKESRRHMSPPRSSADFKTSVQTALRERMQSPERSGGCNVVSTENVDSSRNVVTKQAARKGYEENRDGTKATSVPLMSLVIKEEGSDDDAVRSFHEARQNEGIPSEVELECTAEGIPRASSADDESVDEKRVPERLTTSPLRSRSATRQHGQDSPWRKKLAQNLIEVEEDDKRITPREESFSERPWRHDMVVQRVKSFGNQSAQMSRDDGVCQCSNSVFSGNDELVDFFLPLMGMACTCGKRSQLLENPEEPTALENILRPWQVDFLGAFGIERGDQLVKAHHRSGKALAAALRQYRKKENMTSYRTKSCATAIQIWAKTAKAFVRSIRTQLTTGTTELKLPNTLYILSSFLETMPSQIQGNSPHRGLREAVPLHEQNEL